VAGGFRGRSRGSELPQLVVHQREQLGGGVAVAGLRGVEEAGHIGHDDESTGTAEARAPETASQGPRLPAPDVYVFLDGPLDLVRDDTSRVSDRAGRPAPPRRGADTCSSGSAARTLRRSKSSAEDS